MSKKQKPPMSLWGVGPIFFVVSLFVFGVAIYFSSQKPEVFYYSGYKHPTYIFSAILIVFGSYLWIGQGRKIDTYIRKGILATKGGYGIVRNPIYSGILFIITGVLLLIQSWLMLAILPVIYIILICLLKQEDKVLINAFGEEYTNYKKQVNSVIPKLKSFYTAFLYPVETGKITKDLYALKSYDVNFFIYKTNNSFICFDTGYGNKKMMDEFKKLDLTPKDVSMVFLTHTDVDHIKGLDLFSHSKLYMGENEEALIKGKMFRLKFILKNKRIKRDYILLQDNQIIKVDNVEIKALFTPGHTIGHVSYLINNEILIAGDSVVLQNGFIKPFFRILSMNHKQTKKTARRIEVLKDKCVICTAHTGVMKKNSPSTVVNIGE